MPKVYFTGCNGELHVIEANNGDSLMEVAIDNIVFGIEAECGGACSCATCHAYIDELWLEKLPEISDIEGKMLDHVFERKDNSRLTCQIFMSDELDGIELEATDND